MLEERGIEHAAGSQAWLRRTLEQIVSQVRRLLDVTGVSFLVVDPAHAHIHPAASWFASDAVRAAFVPVLDRPYEAERPGVTEAAVETGRPVLIGRLEDWPGAAGLHDRLFENLDTEDAERLWDWYSSSSFLSCPVRTRDGRILGVLALARSLPRPAFSAEEVRFTEALAELAAFALERAQLLDDEESMGRAARALGATLDPDEVVAAMLAQVRELTGAESEFLKADSAGRVRGGTEPALAGGDVRVPVALGARLFGVLAVEAPQGGFAAGAVARLVALAPVAAAALANAHAYDRERRVAHAMTAGFVPQRPPELDEHEVGLVYEPAGRQASGGDVFGIWTLPGGGLGLLVGDVSGSGLEVAATAAMVRFFVEARTFDCDRPAEVLRQTNEILRSRLPEGLFVPAFLAIAEGRRLRWCNAGHPPPQLLRAGGAETAALGTTGLPLGIDAGAAYEERECALSPGDVLVAATDGLWEARRDGVQFGDARLADLLAEHGRALAPQALAERLRDEAHAWAPQLDDDLVVLAVRVRR